MGHWNCFNIRIRPIETACVSLLFHLLPFTFTNCTPANHTFWTIFHSNNVTNLCVWRRYNNKLTSNNFLLNYNDNIVPVLSRNDLLDCGCSCFGGWSSSSPAPFNHLPSSNPGQPLPSYKEQHWTQHKSTRVHSSLLLFHGKFLHLVLRGDPIAA